MTDRPKTESELAAEARERVREISPADAAALAANGAAVTWLDVREPNEWNLFRLAGAVHIPLARLVADAEARLSRDARVVCYCGRGNRSVIAADRLSELGFTDVASLRGGIMAWIDEGHEVEQ